MGNGWPRCSVLIFVGRKDNNIRVVIFVGCVHVCVCVFLFSVFICFANSTLVMHDDEGLRHMSTKMISKFEKTKDQT